MISIATIPPHDPIIDLPAGVTPYEDYDFEPYFQDSHTERQLCATWRVFTKVKDVHDDGRRLENISWRLWFKERRKVHTQLTFSYPHFQSSPPPATFHTHIPLHSLPCSPLPPTSFYHSDMQHNSTPPHPAVTATPTIPPLTIPTSPVVIPSHPTSRKHNRTSHSPSFMPHSQQIRPTQHTHMDHPSFPSLQQFDSDLSSSLRRVHNDSHRITDDLFGNIERRFHTNPSQFVHSAKAERTRALLELGDKHGLSDDALNDIIKWARIYLSQDETSVDSPHHPIPSATSTISTSTPVSTSPSSPPSVLTSLSPDTSSDFLPISVADGRALIQCSRYTPRPHVGAFCHSLERNGANNFLLYLVRHLRDDINFQIISPKDGVMRSDYEALGMSVSIASAKSPTYRQEVLRMMCTFKYVIANTIMMTEVVNVARELHIPCLWVIHEAWPRHQFEYYAKEVFMTPHVDEESILKAFSNAWRIVFPAKVQRQCYKGLFDESKCRVIYNGIPLASINELRVKPNRDFVRSELGFGKDDLVLLHMGSVCRRKGQLLTCQVFADLHASNVRPLGRNLRLLIVGARYIRAHEVEYIEECRETLEAADALTHGAARIIDVSKNVLGYYLAADMVLCPSMNEVLPLVICEAMAFERAVIASRIDGIPEAIEDGVEGLLIEAGNGAELYDGVMRLASDDALRERMGAAGRKRVLHQFSFEDMSRSYRETIGKDLNLDGHECESVASFEQL